MVYIRTKRPAAGQNNRRLATQREGPTLITAGLNMGPVETIGPVDDKSTGPVRVINALLAALIGEKNAIITLKTRLKIII